MEFYYTYDYKNNFKQMNYSRKTILFNMTLEEFGKKINKGEFDFFSNFFSQFRKCFTYKDVLFKCPNFDTNPNSYYNDPINIPKKKKILYNGKIINKYRTIIEPKREIKSFQKQMKKFLEKNMKILPHDACQSYTRNRSIISNSKKHKDSNYFLRIDIKDFFGSISPALMERNLKKLYQFSTIDNKIHIETYLKNISPQKNDFGFNEWNPRNSRSLVRSYEEVLETILKIGFLNNKLPQGSPLSPILSNLYMIPYDYEISKYTRDNKLIYTRYADDMIFSSKINFDKRKVISKIENLLNSSGLSINHSKTTFKKIRQRVFVTGIKINHNHEISYGYKKHMQLKRDLFLTLIEMKNGFFNKDINNRLIGRISFASSINKKKTEIMLRKYSLKFKIQYNNLFKYLKTNNNKFLNLDE